MLAISSQDNTTCSIIPFFVFAAIMLFSLRAYNWNGHLGVGIGNRTFDVFLNLSCPFQPASAGTAVVYRVRRGIRRPRGACELRLNDLVHGLASHLFGYFLPVEFLLFALHLLHRDRLVVLEGRSARRVQAMRLRPGSRVKIRRQLRCVVWGRKTEVTLAYSSAPSPTEGERARTHARTHRVHAPVKVDVVDPGAPASVLVLVLESLGKERLERGLVRAWVDVAHEDEAVERVG